MRDPGRNPPDLGDPGRVVAEVFGCRPDQVADAVVVSPFVPLAAFRRHVEVVTAELAPPFFYRGFTGVVRGRPVTVIHTGVGPSRVGDCLGFLALTPARRVVFAGAVGGLGPDHGIGDWFVPTAVADGEGFTRYVREPFPDLVAAAPRLDGLPGRDGPEGRFLASRGMVVRDGPVFTIGSIAFESRDNLLALRAAGYRAVEMELSALYAAAGHHGLEPRVLTYVSDLPLESSLWQPRSADEKAALKAAYRALPELALACAAEGT